MVAQRSPKPLGQGSSPWAGANYTLFLIFSLIYTTNKLGGSKMKSIDTIRLRKTVGWLGMLLPIIVLVLCLIFQCVPGHVFPDSISQTYYFAPTITPFMGILIAASILLMCYKGYERIDDVINTLTGIAGLCICLFPCFNPYYPKAALVGTF